ncbi:MAG: SDR family oxidoreductase [Sulfobacillus sp.]
MTRAGRTMVALVTGGVHGLGQAVCQRLSADGMRVYATGRRPAETLGARASRAVAGRGSVQTVVADAGDAEATGRLFAEIERREGHLDVLVNAAGPFVSERRALADYSSTEVSALFAGNALAVAEHCRLAIPLMAKDGFGRIINFGYDGAGRLAPWPYRTAYAAAKAAVVALTLSLAQEVASDGITVNAICPGRIDDPWKERSIAQARRRGAAAAAPIGRPGCGEDVARLIAFLIEPDSDYLTGCVIDLNGGEDVRRGRQAH